LIGYTGKTPPRIREEVFATTLPGVSEVKHLPAKRLMHLCTQCGVCRGVCPEDIDIGGLLLAGRRQMHRSGKAPWAFHDFFLRDMEHANGGEAGLAVMPGSGSGRAGYAFFPGCQIGAGDPNLVLRAYDAIAGLDPDAGIFLMCCGAPAEWAGDDERHGEAVASLRARWESLGSPTLLMACPTCMREFREHLPDIAVTSVYEWLDARLPREADPPSYDAAPGEGAGRAWAVFDPCSSAGEEGAKAAVRNLVRRTGILPEELPVQSRVARCCGYGGQPSVADPAFAGKVAGDRAGESDLPYVAWCFNCRDAYIKEGKYVKHVLELLFPEDGSDGAADAGGAGSAVAGESALPTVTERRRNREYLKGRLVSKFGAASGVAGASGMAGSGAGDDHARAGASGEPYDFTLSISDELLRKMDGEKILEDDVYQVVGFMRSSGRRSFDAASGTHSGYRKIGHTTYWVSYRENAGGDELTLVNVYSHRMSVDMERIWNGRKTREEFIDE
jgi:Fe-S oxidoreductase